MILHARWQGHHRSTRPVLVWLHGFLGSAEDWTPVLHYLKHWPLLSVDLPGHGGSQGQQIRDFSEFSQRLTATLNHHQVDRYWLIGYSLGARLAYYHTCRHDDGRLCGLLAEGGHFGLGNADEREARKQHDLSWAQRFLHQPLPEVLEMWYQQPVFADLTAFQRKSLIARRLHNRVEGLAAMLSATSLAVQPDLLPELRSRNLPIHCICGEWDVKFLNLMHASGVSPVVIRHAGHNTHLANPTAFAQQIALLLKHF